MTYALCITALADSTRRRLFDRLRRRPHAVGELAGFLRVSQPAVSQHLAVLRRARLVRSRRDGRRHIYRPDPAGIAALRTYVDRMWTDALQAYANSFEERTK
ncbi:MAG TPA: metalloregulator ArsR/SmtB family transcription factor [Candidatus Eisenbacteria bacterium]|nr:metalloregulator ArsR/SmtB family transcription factor [Candidatus Eisenbacteria bacterium]